MRNSATDETIETVDERAIEAVAGLQITSEMREAAPVLALTYRYGEAATKAETEPEAVREWTRNPNFVMAVGWFVVGLADNE